VSYRFLVVPIVGAIALLTGFLVYGNLNDNLVYYLTPPEAVARKTEFGADERFRLGGFVKKGTVKRSADGVAFTVESGGVEIPVVHSGVPSQMFSAGIGVIVEGVWDGDTFRSNTLIVKHDEEYRPPDEGPAPNGGRGAGS
jgi:cytochrome c-type biogenesis protein CcmE